MNIDDVKMTTEPRIRDGYVGRLEDRSQIESLAFEHSSSDQFFICGFLPGEAGHLLYSLPKLGLRELFQLFEVGNRLGGMEPDVEPDVESALEQLEKIDQHSELVPFFADPGGIKIRIRLPLADETKELIDDTITHFAAEPMVDDDGYVGSTVAKTGIIHFWWD